MVTLGQRLRSPRRRNYEKADSRAGRGAGAFAAGAAAAKPLPEEPVQADPEPEAPAEVHVTTFTADILSSGGGTLTVRPADKDSSFGSADTVTVALADGLVPTGADGWPISVSELTQALQVDITYLGGVETSDPPQVLAGALVILVPDAQQLHRLGRAAAIQICLAAADDLGADALEAVKRDALADLDADGYPEVYFNGNMNGDQYVLNVWSMKTGTPELIPFEDQIYLEAAIIGVSDNSLQLESTQNVLGSYSAIRA